MEETYEDDPSHPIPFVNNVDAQIDTDRGMYVGLVIASPLANDARSVKRLTKKIEGYIEHLEHLQTRWRMTQSQSMKVRFYVDIHPDPASEIFSLIEQYRTMIESKSIEFRLSTKNDAFGIQ